MFESIFDPFHGMHTIGNMDDVRFPDIYILSNIVYYILPLTIMEDKLSVTYLQCIMVMSKINV